MEKRFDKSLLSMFSFLEMIGSRTAVFQPLALRENLYHSGLAIRKLQPIYRVWFIIKGGYSNKFKLGKTRSYIIGSYKDDYFFCKASQ